MTLDAGDASRTDTPSDRNAPMDVVTNATRADAGMPRTCLAPDRPMTNGTDVWEGALGRATVTVQDRDSCARTYSLRTTAMLREGQPGNPRTVTARC
jgi:hypothetical protein